MGGFLEKTWDAWAGTRLPCVLASASGPIGDRLPDPGAKGDLLIGPGASLEFRTPDLSQLGFTRSGITRVVRTPGGSTVIPARDVAALNIHFGRLDLATYYRHGADTCLLEITLTGSNEKADFARLRAHSSEHMSEWVVPFARQLQKARDRGGLPHIEVTKSYEGGYRGGMRVW